MENIQQLLSVNIPAIPKEMIPALAFGLILIGIILVLIFFVVCVIYINSQSKPTHTPVKPLTREDVLKNKQNQEQTTTTKESVQESGKCEDLPPISGRIGELLGLLGIFKIGPITKAFFQAIEAIRSSTYDLRWRYKLPCFMILGPQGSGKTTLLNNLNFEHIGADDSDSPWKLFKEAAIFEFPTVNASEDKSKFWSFISELFVFIRPRRPLDGLIITVPADLFLSEITNIEKQAREMFDRIFKFQRDINFKLPIYFIITKTDKIYGFQEFVHLLKETTKQQIFGWSCPYSLDIAFTPNWINEIFDTIDDGIRKALFYFSRTRTLEENLEKAILFEAYFEKIKPFISEYLLTMFRTHNPMDGMILRGVYFIGRQKELEVSPTGYVQLSALTPGINVDASLNHLHTDDLYFVQDLFKDKIFKEFNIAHPIIKDSGGMTKKEYRNKLIFAGSVLVCSIGWIWGNGNIRFNVQNYTNVMLNIKKSLLKIKYLEDSMTSTDDQILINNQASNLLKDMPIVHVGDFLSIFVPQSWFLHLNRTIKNTLELVFDSVIVKAMYIDLNFNTKNILLKSQSSSLNKRELHTQQDIFDINHFDSFKELIDFTDKIKDITKISSEYNSMRNLESNNNVDDITEALFKNRFEISNEMRKHIPNIRVMPPQFNLTDFQSNIENSLTTIFDNFVQDTLNVTVEKVLSNVAHDLHRLYEVGRNSKISYTVSDLAKLYNKLELVEDIFNNKNFAWVRNVEFNPTPEYKKILDKLQSTEVISAECIKDLVHFANTSFEHYKSNLETYKSELSDNLIEDQSPSPGFIKIKEELKSLLDLSFICSVSGTELINELPSNKMLIWDTKRLKELCDSIDAYYNFVQNMPEGMRAQFFEIYKAVIKKCYYPIIKVLLGNAQIFEDTPLGTSKSLLESSYKKQCINIQNSSIAIPKIVKIIDELLEDENLKDCGFADLIIKQYLGLLIKIDNLFTAEKLYSTNPALFDNWDGNGSPTFMNMNSQASIKQYLNSQYERMKFLATELASPVIDLLTIPVIYEKIRSKQLIRKWQEIINQINDYEQNKPGNSIAALETFITERLNKVSADSVDAQGELKDMSMNDADYFLSQRSAVAQSLLNRVDIVQYDKAAEIYQNVREIFNNKLSGKFPFGQGETEASFSDIEEFVNAFKTIDISVVTTLKRNKDQKHVNSEIFDFISEMESLVPFFEAWIAQSKSSDPKTCPLMFNVLLRPFPNMEALTSSLLDRTFSFNNVVVLDGKDGTYFIGDKIVTLFGWVASGNEKPNPKASAGKLSIEENLAAFSYTGKWAMFRLIEEHRISKGIINPDGVLLQFDVPIIDAKDGTDLSVSKIIFKITPLLRVEEKSKTLAWPAKFPTTCPDIHNSLNTNQYSRTTQPTSPTLVINSSMNSSKPTVRPLDAGVSFDE